jgi:predicted GH43/DUF377 family glycosyl hydrolase
MNYTRAIEKLKSMEDKVMNRRIVSLLSIVAMVILFSGINIASDDLHLNMNMRVNFMPYEHNPVFAPGPAGSWDDKLVFMPHVVHKDGLFHLFYNGSNGSKMAIGYANSPDGFTFTRSTANPVLDGEGSGFDAFQVTAGLPLVVGDTWILYYSARSAPGPGPGQAIGRATASSPEGPWTRDFAPVLVAGSPGEWDSGFVTPNSVIATDDGYVMYYTGGAQFGVPPQLIGVATSLDGVHWVKYNDPCTTAPPFAESDPVLDLGPAGSYDSRSASFACVLKTTSGWEMFYNAITDMPTCCDHQIGYAVSDDGIHWTKYEDNPILALSMEPLAASSRYMESSSVIVKGSTYFLYYDYGPARGGIGVALGTVSRCHSDMDQEEHSLQGFFSLEKHVPRCH